MTRYPGTQESMRVGDVVTMGSAKGVVVACIGTAEFSAGYSPERSNYRHSGVMIDTDFGWLVHYPDQDAVDVERVALVARKAT